MMVNILKEARRVNQRGHYSEEVEFCVEVPGTIKQRTFYQLIVQGKEPSVGTAASVSGLLFLLSNYFENQNKRLNGGKNTNSLH